MEFSRQEILEWVAISFSSSQERERKKLIPLFFPFHWDMPAQPLSTSGTRRPSPHFPLPLGFFFFFSTGSSIFSYLLSIGSPPTFSLCMVNSPSIPRVLCKPWVLGKEKNGFIALPDKGRHSRFLPLKTMCPNSGGLGEEFHSSSRGWCG